MVNTLKMLILLLQLFLLGNIFSLSNIIVPNIEYDYLEVLIYENGDVRVSIHSNIDFESIPIPVVVKGLEEGVVLVHYTIGRYVDCAFYFRLDLTSRDVAEAQAVEAVKYVERWLSIQFDQENKSEYQWHTYKVFKYVFYTKNFNPDAIEEKILNIIPKDGLASMINKETIKEGERIFFITYPNIRSGKVHFDMYKPKYFKFKIGGTYTLDIFKIFNFTGPLIISKNVPKRGYTVIQIRLAPSYKEWTKFKVVTIKWEVPQFCSSGTLEGYNYYFANFGVGGKEVKSLRLIFKIVESGYKVEFNPANMCGIMLIILVFGIIAFITYKLRRRVG